MLERLINYFHPESRHWYYIKMSYKNKDRVEQFNYHTEIGFVQKRQVLCERSRKELEKPLHEIPEIRHLLCNGYLNATIVCYLGYFRDPPKKK